MKRSPFYSSLHRSRHDNCSAFSSIKSSSSRPEGTGFPLSVEEIASWSEIIRCVSDRRVWGCTRHYCIVCYDSILLNYTFLLCRGWRCLYCVWLCVFVCVFVWVCVFVLYYLWERESVCVILNVCVFSCVCMKTCLYPCLCNDMIVLELRICVCMCVKVCVYLLMCVCLSATVWKCVCDEGPNLQECVRIRVCVCMCVWTWLCVRVVRILPWSLV